MIEVAWSVLTQMTLELFYPFVLVLLVFDFIGSLLFNKR